MIISMKNASKERVFNLRNGEKYVDLTSYSDENNRIICGVLIPGASIGMHLHENDSEIIYIIKGTATFLTDEGEEVAQEGMCHYCSKGHSHSMLNKGTEDVIFFAVIPKH